MSLNKEGQHSLSLHSSERVDHIYTLGYSDSLTPHRWSRRNQVSKFENEVNRREKTESGGWTIFNQSCLQSKCDEENKSDV